jgi:hypothetical protein
MSARDLLLHARKILQTREWVKNDFKDGDSYCAIGAINQAVRERGGRRFKQEAIEALDANLPDWVTEFNPRARVMRYNDWTGRPGAVLATTREDVLDLFCKAAKEFKE